MNPEAKPLLSIEGSKLTLHMKEHPSYSVNGHHQPHHTKPQTHLPSYPTIPVATDPNNETTELSGLSVLAEKKFKMIDGLSKELPNCNGLRYIDNQLWSSGVMLVSKLDFYRRFKVNVASESYINIVTFKPFRKGLSKFRCSNHR